MSEYPKDRMPTDLSRISLEEEREVRYWSRYLGCTPDELRKTIESAGTFAVEKVREYLAAQALPVENSVLNKENTMSDNLADRGPRDRSRISLNEDWEVRYWANELNCSADELREAVKNAGSNSVDKVREYLKK